MADVNALTGEARVKQVEAQITPVVQAVADLKIENNEQYVAAGAILTDVKKAEKAVKAGKEAITKPLNEALKAARALFKPTEEKVAAAKRDLLTVMGDFKREQDRIAAEKQRKLEEKIERGTIKNPETILRNIEKIETPDNAGAGITTTTRKVVEIDWEKLDKKYLAELLTREKVRDVLTVEIRKDALGNKAQGIAPIVIEGVTVREEESIY